MGRHTRKIEDKDGRGPKKHNELTDRYIRWLRNKMNMPAGRRNDALDFWKRFPPTNFVYPGETLRTWKDDDHEGDKLDAGLLFALTENLELANRLQDLAARKNHDLPFLTGTMPMLKLYTRFKRKIQPYKTYESENKKTLQELRDLFVTRFYRPASPGANIPPIFRDLDKDLKELDRVLAECDRKDNQVSS